MVSDLWEKRIRVGLGITEEKMRGRVDKKTVIFVYY